MERLRILNFELRSLSYDVQAVDDSWRIRERGELYPGGPVKGWTWS